MEHKKEFNTGPALFLLIYQPLLLLSLPFYFYYAFPSMGMIGMSVLLLFLTGMSITGGYHRFYAHRSYKTNTVIEAIMLFFASMAGQGSALRWSFDHRLHHAHVDTDEDPYSINKGFWYAHFLWIMHRPRPIDPKVVPDLMKNKLVQFQHRHSHMALVVTNFIAFAFVGWLLNDYMGAFFLAVWTRLFTLHHCTWFINSLAHTWGDKPFCQEQTAVNNWVVALLTFGEGYHNYHHTFANDYRNGIRWFHYDPTKWLIWTLSKLGLVESLRRMDPYTIKKRMVIERKNLLLERLCDLWYVQKDELEKSIQSLSDRLMDNMAHVNELRERYYTLRKECQEAATLDNIRKEIRALKKSVKADWRLWVRLSKDILKMKPLPMAI